MPSYCCYSYFLQYHYTVILSSFPLLFSCTSWCCHSLPRISRILWRREGRRELRKKRFEPKGSEKYREVNNNIKKCMKKAKENGIGEQCSEIEENLKKNNSKRAYQLVKDLTTVKQGKATTVQDRSGKCLTEEREILNRWTEYCSELYSHKTNGDQ